MGGGGEEGLHNAMFQNATLQNKRDNGEHAHDDGWGRALDEGTGRRRRIGRRAGSIEKSCELGKGGGGA